MQGHLSSRNEAAVIPNRDLAALPGGNTALLRGDCFQGLQFRRPRAGRRPAGARLSLLCARLSLRRACFPRTGGLARRTTAQAGLRGDRARRHHRGRDAARRLPGRRSGRSLGLARPHRCVLPRHPAASHWPTSWPASGSVSPSSMPRWPLCAWGERQRRDRGRGLIRGHGHRDRSRSRPLHRDWPFHQRGTRARQPQSRRPGGREPPFPAC